MTDQRMLDLTTMLKLANMMGTYLATKDPENHSPFAKEVEKQYDKLIDSILKEYTSEEAAMARIRIGLDNICKSKP